MSFNTAAQGRASQRSVLADTLPRSALRDIALVIGFAALVGALAQVVILLPFTPVPITGQTFGVLAGGLAVGWRRAAAGMAVYALAGLAGVPWFAQAQGGLHSLVLPSFGYIVGFVVAATLLGELAERRCDRNPLTTLAAMAAGSFVIYLFGLTWLAATLHISLVRAIQLGVIPFLIGDAIKSLLAAGLLPGTWRLLGRSG